jgi:Holliday junction DNA helicase RuvA
VVGFLSGIIKAKNINYIVVLTSSGVGYKVFVSSIIAAKLKADDAIELFIHTHVREDQLSLFGFSSEQDLEVFELLISVSGVGPKTAMNIFGVGNGAQIKRAIGSKNKVFFKGVSGLGTKTTEKIFVELKNKVEELPTTPNGELTGSAAEAMSALMNLGYQKYEIFDFFKRNHGVEEETVEMIVKRFLKK